MLSNNPKNAEGMAHLGYPAYLAKILGTAKLLGAIALVQMRFRTLKEWSYAGFSVLLVGASASHGFSGDPIVKVIIPLVMLAILLATFRMWKSGLKK